MKKARNQTDPDAEETALTLAEAERLAEIDFVARKLFAKYHQLVESYKNVEKLSSAEAFAKADEAPDEAFWAQQRLKPLENFSWFDLNAMPGDANLTVSIWEQIKQAAREEVLSGTYAFSKVVRRTPYENAIYLAVRAAFQDQWTPQNGGEQLLVDQLAQMYTQYLYWLHRLEIRTEIDREVEDGNVQRRGRWKPTPENGTTPQWIETTAKMIDVFHTLFLRTLRALRDLRRWGVNINITGAGQVNIGQQQVNMQQPNNKDSE